MKTCIQILILTEQDFMVSPLPFHISDEIASPKLVNCACYLHGCTFSNACTTNDPPFLESTPVLT